MPRITHRHGRSNAAENRGAPDDEQQPKLRAQILLPARARRRLRVDVRQRIRVDPRRQHTQVRDGVHDRDGKHKRIQEPQADLQRNGLGQVGPRARQLLGHVGDSVGGADRERAVEHAAQERHAAGPPRDVVLVEAVPDELAGRVARGHGGYDDDGDEAAHDDEEHAQLLGERHEAVRQDDDQRRDPADD